MNKLDMPFYPPTGVDIIMMGTLGRVFLPKYNKPLTGWIVYMGTGFIVRLGFLKIKPTPNTNLIFYHGFKLKGLLWRN